MCEPIDLLTNTCKITKLCVNVRGYERGYVNVNITVFVSVNGNVVDCVDAHKKFLRLLTKLNGCAIMAS